MVWHVFIIKGELGELNNGSPLNIYYGNSDRVGWGLWCWIGEKKATEWKVYNHSQDQNDFGMNPPLLTLQNVDKP